MTQTTWDEGETMKKMEAIEALKAHDTHHQALYRCRVCLFSNIGRVEAKPEDENDAAKFSKYVIKASFPQNFRMCRACGTVTVQLWIANGA